MRRWSFVYRTLTLLGSLRMYSLICGAPVLDVVRLDATEISAHQTRTEHWRPASEELTGAHTFGARDPNRGTRYRKKEAVDVGLG